MTKLQAINKSIAHLERMIKWARNKKDDPNIRHDQMCLVMLFVYLQQDIYNEINKIWNGKCGYGKRNKWFNVNTSMTWAEWVINARKFLYQLKSLKGGKAK